MKKLDVLSNQLFINMLQASYSTCCMVSEENQELIVTPRDKRVSGELLIDPLPGGVGGGGIEKQHPQELRVNRN